MPRRTAAAPVSPSPWSYDTLATFRRLIAVSIYLHTRCRAIAGGSAGLDATAGCRHERAVAMSTRGSYEEACTERAEFVRQAEGFYVSPIQRIPGVTGETWGWSVCPDCGKEGTPD